MKTDEYEGHTPIEFWQVVGQGEPEETTHSLLATSLWHIPYWMSFNKAMQGNSRADRKLIQDAPKLLAEVKRLRRKMEGLQEIWNYLDPKGYAWQEEEFVVILKEYGFYGEGEVDWE